MAANLSIVITARDMVTAPMKGITGAISGVVSGLGKIGLAGMGVQAITSGVRGLGDALGVGLNSSLETVTAQLNAFTKDGAKSAEILEGIRKEAATTPFAFQEMASATASLLPAAKSSGVALMDLVRQAEILAASNPAQGLEGAAFSIKEALSGDFVSIVERFNLPRTRLKQLKDEGVPAMEAISIAMKEMGLDADLVSNMSTTASGRWSTFMDTIDTLRANLSKGVFTFFSDQLVNVQALLDENMPLLESWAATVGGALTDGLKTVGDTLKTVVDSVKEFVDNSRIAQDLLKGDFAGAWDEVQKAMSAFAPTGERIQKLMDAVGKAIGTFVPQPLQDFVSGLFDSATAATDGKGPMQLLADAVNAVSEAVEGVISFLKDHQEVQAVLTGIVVAATTAYALATAAAIAHGVATKATAIATGLMTAAQAALNVVLTANPIGIVVVALAGLATAIIYAWNTNEDFRKSVETAWKVIGDTAGWLGKTVGDAFGTMGKTIGDVWDGASKAAREAINNILRAINSMIGAWNAIEFKIPGFQVDIPEIDVPGVGKVGGGSLGWGGIAIATPDITPIPLLDRGGIITRPTLAMLAANNRPEAVIPLGSGGVGIDYDRLERIISSRPVILQIDGRTFAQLVTTEQGYLRSIGA